MHSPVAIAPLKLVCDSYNSFGDKINDLTDVEDDAEGRGSDHEVGEHFLLGGVADVAVHYVGARHHLTLDHSWQVEAFVHSVKDVKEGSLNGRLYK